MAQLLTLESMDPDRDISIYINSPGGSFTALTAIYDTMQFVRPDIQTICLGQAASAAAVLLAAGTPGKRFALANSRILIHQPSTEGGGQASDVEIQAREILRMRTLLEEMIAKHSNRTAEQVAGGHRARQDPHRRGGRGVRPGRPRADHARGLRPDGRPNGRTGQARRRGNGGASGRTGVPSGHGRSGRQAGQGEGEAPGWHASVTAATC